MSAHSGATDQISDFKSAPKLKRQKPTENAFRTSAFFARRRSHFLLSHESFPLHSNFTQTYNSVSKPCLSDQRSEHRKPTAVGSLVPSFLSRRPETWTGLPRLALMCFEHDTFPLLQPKLKATPAFVTNVTNGVCCLICSVFNEPIKLRYAASGLISQISDFRCP